jgi:hypothetical protein
MKKRVLRPYKLLAVALGLTPACANEPAAQAPHATPSASASTSASIETPPIASSAAPSSAAAPSASTTAPSFAPNPELEALRGEMAKQTPAKVWANHDHYRPLCDANGYPLVGNVAVVKPPAPMQPSRFCEEIRESMKK